MTILFAVIFLTTIGFGMVLPILSFLAKQMGASALQVSLLISGWALTQALTAPLWGPLSDRFGRKSVLALGLFGNSITFLLMAIAGSYEVMLIAWMAGGVLAGATSPVAYALAADLSAPQNRPHAMGVLVAAFSAGLVLGPIIGGGLAALGLRVPLWVAGIASLMSMGLALSAISESAASDRELTNKHSPNQWISVPKKAEALLYCLSVAGAFTASSLFSVMGYFFIDRLGSGEVDVGIAFAVLGIGQLIPQLGLLGFLSRRRRAAWILQGTLLVSSIGFLVLGSSREFMLALAAVTVTGTGVGLLRPSLASLMTQGARLEHGRAMGLFTGFDALGRTIGPPWAGFLYSFHPSAPFISAALISALFAMWVGRRGLATL
jgi:DHA1 family multidrug resistance protein-like MFS transporter